MANKFVEVNFNDRWKVKLLDHLAQHQQNQYKFWEKERMAMMYGAIRPDDTILDIGTCHGDMAVVWASWLGENGKIILVEPAPHFWPEIKAHFDKNGLTPYQCFQVLVSNETPEVIALPYNIETLDEKELVWPIVAEGEINPELGFAHINDHAPDQPPPMPVIKIDDMNLPKIDILTMDIEGSEYEALEGARETIRKDHPILFISVHPEMMWREHHHSPDDLHVMLSKWGYDATYLHFDHEEHWMYRFNPHREIQE